MNSTLVLQAVGTQEVQGELLDDEFSTRELGVGARVNGRALGEWLCGLSEDELRDVVDYRTLRNGPCYERLDGDPGSWTLALLATDQAGRHDGDTLDIARAMRRWFALRHPEVVVTEPLVITHAPHLVTDDLTAEVERLLVEVRGEQSFEHVVVLPQGGTPALRVLLEHLAGRIFAGAAKVERLLPDGRGGTHAHSLLRTIKADDVAQQLHIRLSDAIKAGRYATASELARALVKLDLASSQLVGWCDAGRRIVDDQPDWTRGLRPGDEATRRLRLSENTLHRLGAMIEVVGRLEHAGAMRDALATFVTAAELVSLAWCEEAARVGGSQLEQLSLTAVHDCKPRPTKARHSVDRARHAAACAALRCPRCPLVGDELGERILDASGGGAAHGIRAHPATLVELRNDLVHVRKTRDLDKDLTDAIKKDVRALRQDFTVSAEPSLASLLADAALAAIGRKPPNPLDVIDERIAALRT